ncbi:hypothetical protein RN22_15745 [Grimontia sp. AD028]|uniref:porin n=1 Tax=Grimontia sp. AD028 TaxID=1581149 RepID=UPI00061B2379|nr:porin [Grimontia sp. AD028]KKD59369.1 hypothetical protein RN22_15745 [Grimontia sp. AD028]
MKKTILAMAVPALLAAGAAQAAVSVYDQDGTSVSLSGTAEIQYRLTGKQDHANEDAQIRVDDGDLSVGIKHQINDDLYSVGKLQLRVGETTENTADAGSGSGDVTNGDLYAGLGGSFGEVTFGRQAAFIDDAGISTEKELKDSAGLQFEDTDFDQLVKYSYSNDNFWAGASYNVSQSDTAGKNNDELYEIAFGLPVAEVFDFAIFYGNYVNEQSDDVDNKGVVVQGTYSDGPFYAGLLYGNFENEQASTGAKTGDTDVWEFAVAYTIGDGKFGAGVAFEDDSKSKKEDTSWYVNYSYSLSSLTTVYAEVGFEDEDAEGVVDDFDGTGYAVGLEVKF